MLRMTEDQMLGAPMADEDFLDWYVEDFMRGELADFYISNGPTVCRTFTANGRLYARHFGIARPDLQAQFITLMWVLAPNFWEDPGFATILSDPGLDEASKIEAIHSVPNAVAERAMANSDSEAWYPELREDNILGVPYVGISDEEVDDLLAEIRAKRVG